MQDFWSSPGVEDEDDVDGEAVDDAVFQAEEKAGCEDDHQRNQVQF